MAELFGCSTDNISLHLKNIFKTNELDEDSVTEVFSATATDGKNYRTKFYNLDAIISVGYRVNSTRATQFRIWATARLKEYIIKGYALDDDRLKGDAGGNYWHELLSRIRDIRSSEKAYLDSLAALAKKTRRKEKMEKYPKQNNNGELGISKMPKNFKETIREKTKEYSDFMDPVMARLNESDAKYIGMTFALFEDYREGYLYSIDVMSNMMGIKTPQVEFSLVSDDSDAPIAMYSSKTNSGNNSKH